MFSSRLDFRQAPNALSVIIDEKRRLGLPIIDLTESNPTRAGFGYSEALEALRDARASTYEPHPRGLMHAREAVAAYYAERGVDVSPERIWLTASTSEAYSLVIKLLADPGCEVLVPRPSYPLLDILAWLEGVRIGSYPLRYGEGWKIDHDGLESAITSETRAVFVVSPNNPTGSYLTSADRSSLVGTCARHNLALVADEVFFDYRLDSLEVPPCTLTATQDVLTFILSGISKVAALPQMKIGWIVMSGPDDLVREAETYLDLIADTYLSASTPAQHALPAWLQGRHSIQRQILSRLRENLSALEAAAGGAWRVLRAEGGWYAVVQYESGEREEDLVTSMASENGILIHPGFFFDFPREGFLVLSLLTPVAELREGVRLMARRLGR
ncbi:MAG: pyridoxal phosphate-dependent aminotransferase [Acidobacteria bacterium]|nr:pyridoxal phosphate-dependent aminotransferase [Acidobacteriota bacterium]